MQSVIIYRNPLEAAFWESMMNSEASIFFFVIGVGIFWSIVAVQSQNLLLKKSSFGYKRAGKWSVWIASALTALMVIGAYLYSIHG